MTPSSVDDVSIVIVARDEEASIEATITRAVGIAPNAGIVVVDDGSRDETVAIVQRLETRWPTVTLIRSERLGKMSALRAALPQLRRRLTVTLDADTLVDEGALGSLVDRLSREDLDACAGAMRPQASDSLTLAMQRAEFAVLNADRRALARVGGVSILPGAFTIWKTDVLKQLVLDARNDIDLTFDALMSDLRLGFDPGAGCETRVPDQYREVFLQRRRWARRKLHRVARSAATITDPTAPRRARRAQAHVLTVHVILALTSVLFDLGVARAVLGFRKQPPRAFSAVALYLGVAALQARATSGLDDQSCVLVRLFAGSWERATRAGAAWSVLLLPQPNDVGWTPHR